MITVKELISKLENTPKRNGIRYVEEEDLKATLVCLRSFEEACETLVNVADYMGLLKKGEEE